MREGKVEAKCDREASFRELYPILGDSHRQEKIRLRTPGERHCDLLRKSPSACTNCPNNPYRDKENGPLYEAIDEAGHWLDPAQELYERNALGLGSDRETILSEELEVLRCMRQHEVFMAAKLQGSEVARILSKLFSKPQL